MVGYGTPLLLHSRNRFQIVDSNAFVVLFVLIVPLCCFFHCLYGLLSCVEETDDCVYTVETTECLIVDTNAFVLFLSLVIQFTLMLQGNKDDFVLCLTLTAA